MLTVLTALWVLEDMSRQIASQPSTICFAPLLFLLLLGDYGYRLWRRAEACASSHGAWRWAVLPSAIAVLVSALVHPWPMDLRFSLSRGEFEEKAVEVLDGETEQGPQRVGLYWVKRISVGPGRYVAFETGESIIDPVGFGYDPARPPSHPFNRHIVGNWYATEW